MTTVYANWIAFALVVELAVVKGRYPLLAWFPPVWIFPEMLPVLGLSAILF
jgi:hypothetical protein